MVNCVSWVIEYYFLLIMRWKFTFPFFKMEIVLWRTLSNPPHYTEMHAHCQMDNFDILERWKRAESSETLFLELYTLLFCYCVLFTFFCAYVGKNRPALSFSVAFWRAKVFDFGEVQCVFFFL